MTLQQALDLISEAVDGTGGRWADLGAGTGLFTRALARLIGAEGTVHAVDRDPGSLRALRALAARPREAEARIVPLEGDLESGEALFAPATLPLDGALLANALHFSRDPQRVLGAVARAVRPGGRVVLVEYDLRPANPWIPYPVPPQRLRAIAPAAGLGRPVETARHASAYRGELYCAYMERGGWEREVEK